MPTFRDARASRWFHGGDENGSPYAPARGESFDHAADVMRFFDAHLRGMHEGYAGEPPVDYYTMGPEKWRTAPAWPPPGGEWQALHLAEDRALRSVAPMDDEASDRHEVDPALTSGDGSRWGMVVTTGAKRGYGDRRANAERMLSYTSAPLERPLEVTGHPRVHLHLSANATDGAVFVYLEDVAPDGRVRYVTEGLLRLLHRKLAAPLTPGALVPDRTYRRADGARLVPGEVVEVVLDLLPTSYVFPAGHALRVSITGADAGTFDVPWPKSGPLVYDVHRDQAHPSRIELPIYR